MSRAWPWAGCLVFLAGCLEHGDPYLAREDATAPTVTATVPASGAANFVRDAELEVTFSEFMDPLTLSPGIEISQGQERLVVAVTIPADSDNSGDYNPVESPYRVRLRPRDGALETGTSYVLVLRTLLTDTEGNPLAEEVRVPFTTGP